jgi:CBS domain-containing protein
MTFEDLSITNIMTKDVKIAYSNQTIREVCKSMHVHGIGSVVILEGNDDITNSEKPESEEQMAAGIITERDIVSYLGSDKALSLRTKISEIMSTPLVTLSTANSVKDAIETMQLRNIRRLPVMDNKNNNIVGIVTDKDILRKYMPVPTATSGKVYYLIKCNLGTALCMRESLMTIIFKKVLILGYDKNRNESAIFKLDTTKLFSDAFGVNHGGK